MALSFDSPPNVTSPAATAPVANAPNVTSPSETLLNALTVDVEDYFQVSAFESRICRSTWDQFECRVEANTYRILSLLDRCGVRGTFFVLGWVADRYPKLLRRIVSAGHELGSHGYWHQLVYNLTPEAFARDISDSRDAIASACSVEVTAYRAPSFSITERSLWALSILAEQGFKCDSSIFPISGHDRYGYPMAPKEIHQIETRSGSVREFPPSTWTWGRLQIPIGGGYFRLFPLELTCRAVEAVRRAGRPVMFYIHPWELDPCQPKPTGAGWKSHWRHYVGLHRTEARLRSILQRFSFDTMSAAMRGCQQTLSVDVTDRAITA